MKTIRYLAACLLLLIGILYMLPIIEGNLNHTDLLLALFGIVYLTIGFLLSLNINNSKYLRLIYPLIKRRLIRKTIRYLAVCLLFLTGILHMRPMIIGRPNPTDLPMELFGIAYLTIGFLLSINMNYSKYLGLIFPLIELVIGFGALGIKYLGLIFLLIGLGTDYGAVGVKNWIKLLFAIDAVVAICCVLLILKRVKPQASPQFIAI